MLYVPLRTGFAVFFIAVTLSGCTNFQHLSAASPEKQGHAVPALVVTNDPPPSVIYRAGSSDAAIARADKQPDTYDNESAHATTAPLRTQHVETLVGQKAEALSRDLDKLRGNIETSKKRLQSMQDRSDSESVSYYTLVAAINADLQTGTTAGNPILVSRWNSAQDKLNSLSQSISPLNLLATDLSSQASKLAFLLESTRAVFGLSGAVDEDHKKLTEIEDTINQDIIATNRLMSKVNDEISRRSAYLRAERANMQTLSLAIANGELYGESLTNSVFKKAVDGADATQGAPASTPVASGKKPLVIIRFDRPNVNYDRPLYSAVSQALEKYPAAKFNLVAVSPIEGNPAQLSIGATEARKNGEAVLRSLTQMGLPIERVDLSVSNSKDVLNSEVQIYIQ